MFQPIPRTYPHTHTKKTHTHTYTLRQEGNAKDIAHANGMNSGRVWTGDIWTKKAATVASARNCAPTLKAAPDTNAGRATVPPG